tara:strand:- start:216 stop:362 length:147 start_codon:yes stop_codon:yes gene_type:complete
MLLKSDICTVNLNQKPSHINKEKKVSKDMEFLLKDVNKAYDEMIENIK